MIQTMYNIAQLNLDRFKSQNLSILMEICRSGFSTGKIFNDRINLANDKLTFCSFDHSYKKTNLTSKFLFICRIQLLNFLNIFFIWSFPFTLSHKYWVKVLFD